MGLGVSTMPNPSFFYSLFVIIMFYMQTSIHKSSNFLVWMFLIIINIFSAIVVVLFLTNIPNPYPLFLLLAFYALQAYYFMASKTKLLTLAGFLSLTVWLMVSVMDTNVVSLKCSPEIRKPVENRDATKVQKETKNFDSCLNSITFTDNIVYGLLKN